MSQKKFDHGEESLIYANLHLPPREIEVVLNIYRKERGKDDITFTKDNKRDYKRYSESADILEHIPELAPEQRARELKRHLDTLQDGIDALRLTARNNTANFGKGEARELASLSREFRNTLNDIGALSPGILDPKVPEEEAEEPPVEVKYAEQIPENVRKFPSETGTD